MQFFLSWELAARGTDRYAAETLTPQLCTLAYDTNQSGSKINFLMQKLILYSASANKIITEKQLAQTTRLPLIVLN